MQRLLPFSVGVVAGLSGAVGYGRLQRARELPHSASGQPEVLSSHFKYGLPSSPLTTHTYTSHTLQYDQTKKVPVWVCERLTKDNVKGDANRRLSTFKPDLTVPTHFSATNEDYRGSGWSRGHMAPAGDCKHSQCAMDDTFLLTNIVPQDFDNNTNYWNRLEMFCRKLLESYEEVSIVSGPLFLPEDDQESKKRFVHYEVIGHGSVAVPTHLYKVILAERKDDPPAMAAFIVPNRPLGSEPLVQFQTSLEHLEMVSGVTFHSKLDRGKVQDLCANGSCKIMSLSKFNARYRSKSPQTSKERKGAELGG